MKPPIPLHDQRFQWIPSATHNDSDAFRERQRARIKAAQASTKPAIPIKRKTA